MQYPSAAPPQVTFESALSHWPTRLRRSSSFCPVLALFASTGRDALTMSTQTSTVFLLILLVLEQGCGRDTRGSTAPRPKDSDVRESNTSSQQFQYKGRTIVIDEQVDPPKVTIDGISVAVHVLSHPEGKKYSTPAQIYEDFSTLPDLARGVIDSSVLGPAPGRHRIEVLGAREVVLLGSLAFCLRQLAQAAESLLIPPGPARRLSR